LFVFALLLHFFVGLLRLAPGDSFEFVAIWTASRYVALERILLFPAMNSIYPRQEVLLQMDEL